MAEAALLVEERSFGRPVLTHEHGFYQVVFPGQGRLQLRVGDRRGYAGGGQVAVVGPAVEHSCWADAPNRLLVLQLAPALMDEARQEAGRSRGALEPFHPLTPRLAALRALLRIELESGGLGDRLVAESLGLYLGAALARAEETPSAPCPSPSHRRLARQVREYLEAHFTRDLSLREVAAAVGASPSYLQRCFREQEGLSVVAFLHRARLHHAQELLRATDLSIAEVAARSGFWSPGYFARLFSRAIGLSPSRYRALAWAESNTKRR